MSLEITSKWSYLPQEWLFLCAQHLSAQDIFLRMGLVCKNWNQSLQSQLLFKTLLERDFHYLYAQNVALEKAPEIYKKTFARDKAIFLGNYSKEIIKNPFVFSWYRSNICHKIERSQEKIFTLYEKDIIIWDVKKKKAISEITNAFMEEGFFTDMQVGEKNLYVIENNCLRIQAFNGDCHFFENPRENPGSSPIRKIFLNEKARILFGHTEKNRCFIWKKKGKRLGEFKVNFPITAVYIDAKEERILLGGMQGQIRNYSFNGKLISEHLCKNGNPIVKFDPKGSEWFVFHLKGIDIWKGDSRESFFALDKEEKDKKFFLLKGKIFGYNRQEVFLYDVLYQKRIKTIFLKEDLTQIMRCEKINKIFISLKNKDLLVFDMDTLEMSTIAGIGAAQYTIHETDDVLNLFIPGENKELQILTFPPEKKIKEEKKCSIQ